jgi:hypothetical protein
MPPTSEPTVATQTVTVSEHIMKPGIGYVLNKSDAKQFEDATAAQEFFENRVEFWGGGESELLERDSNTAEFQVGGWRRVMVELS